MSALKQQTKYIFTQFMSVKTGSIFRARCVSRVSSHASMLYNGMHLSFIRCIVGAGYYYIVKWLFIEQSRVPNALPEHNQSTSRAFHETSNTAVFLKLWARRTLSRCIFVRPSVEMVIVQIMDRNREYLNGFQGAADTSRSIISNRQQVQQLYLNGTW